jgi:plastocyanin
MGRLLVLLPLSLLLAACGGTSGKSSSSSSAGPVLQTIQLSEKEYLLTPSKITVAKTGTYELKATNDGTITHALEIEGNGVEEKTGDVAPGSTATLRVNLSKDGSYEIYCPIDGHRGQGMAGTLAVGNGSSSDGMTTEETTTSWSPGY